MQVRKISESSATKAIKQSTDTEQLYGPKNQFLIYEKNCTKVGQNIGREG